MIVEYIGEHPSTTFVKDGKSITFVKGKATEVPSWLRLKGHTDFREVKADEAPPVEEPKPKKGSSK